MAGTKRSRGGDGTKTKADRPRIQSSHAGASASRGPAAPKRGGAAQKAARARAQKVVGEVTRAASRPSASAAEPPRPKKAAKAQSALMGGAEVPSTASEAARELASMIAVEALEKKAVGLEILDVAGRVDYADFLVLMSGRSDRHVVALAQSIEDALKKKGQRPLSIEGLPHATWVLIDYGDVVVHVFQEDRRHLYNLEGLWMDARRIPLPAESRPN